MLSIAIEITDLGLPNVQLTKLARRIGVPAHAMISILKAAGFIITGKPNDIFLTESQLEVLAQAYAGGVKQLFVKSKKLYSKGVAIDNKEGLVDFFRSFIPNSELYSEKEIFDAQLDQASIEAYFFEIVNTLNYSPYSSKSRRGRVIQIVLKGVQTFKDLSRKVIATFIRYHYYTFSKDEEPVRSKHSIYFS